MVSDFQGSTPRWVSMMPMAGPRFGEQLGRVMWTVGRSMEYTRPGQPKKNYGKSPFLIGKSTISMVIFNSYVKLPEVIIWLVVWNMNFVTFHSVGNKDPNWRTHIFSEGMKPSTWYYIELYRYYFYYIYIYTYYVYDTYIYIYIYIYLFIYLFIYLDMWK